MTTTKIYLDSPNDIHGEIKKIQLDKQILGEKVTIRDVYFEVLKIGIETIKKQKQEK